MLYTELLSSEQLEQRAMELAGLQRVEGRPGKNTLLTRLDDNEAILQSAYDVVSRAAAAGQPIAAAETWLLDNFYLIEQQIALARRHLPRQYSKQLPRLQGGRSAGYPRVYDLALDLISHQDGRIDRDNVVTFVHAYQAVQPLALGELWAFPTMLRLGLLENISWVGVQIARRREERDTAAAWADRLMSTSEEDPKKLVYVLADLAKAQIALSPTFVEDFYARLQAQGPVAGFVRAWLEHQLSQEDMTTDRLLEIAHHKAAGDQISIANSINSLRFVSTLDWGEFVEELSPVERLLREDPAGVYANQDFNTRDRYRHAVESVARGSRLNEPEVANMVLALARDGSDRDDAMAKSAHVGYYLIDKGRPLLERASHSRVPLLTRLTRLARPLRVFSYISPIVILSCLAAALPIAHAATIGHVQGELAFFVIVGVLAASAFVVPIVNLLVTITLPPRVLPRLDYPEGIPPEHRTIVVVPTLVGKRKDVRSLLDALEVRYLGNRDPNLFFALLTDHTDAADQTLPEDQGLIDLLRLGIDRLNRTYLDDGVRPFYLFHRSRVWNPKDRVWMGYERKRGKLEQFNSLLLAARTADDSSTFEAGYGDFSDIVGDTSVLGSIRYVITLDTDTQLPRGTARLLVGNIAHPLNRPVFDAHKGRVVEGYSILQPRTSISLTSISGSRFTRLFAGEAGIDPYTREVSDVYQDLFGEGSYVGKGIYDVETFARAVGDRFPENQVLSHDLLEGSYARSALVTDVDLIEEHPISYTIDASRRHRWARGDWQLAGWLLPLVPGPEGKRQRNPLSLLSIWKLLDNMRRGLVSGSLLALCLGGWLWQAGYVWLWPLLVVGALFGPVVVTSLVELVHKPAERGWLLHFSLTGRSALRPLLRALLALVFLPYETYLHLSAIGHAAISMLVTHRGGLIWHLPSYAKRNARKTPWGFLLEMWVSPVLAVLITVGFIFVANAGAVDWPYFAPLVILWFAAPLVGWWISQPVRPPSATLDDQQQALLRVLARRTWRFFADFVGPADNWLPPDNYQEYPTAAVAHRTSPTNMGMALLANLVANDFGYISIGELLHRTDRAFRSMEKLERFRGHFRNWYDTQSLTPLAPDYVSAVDSGNLAASLLVVRAGLLGLKGQPVFSPRTFEGIEDTFRAMMDHAPQPSRSRLSKEIASFKDLLASTRPADGADVMSSLDVATASDLLERLHHSAREILRALPTGTDSELRYWAKALYRQCRGFREDFRRMVPDTSSRDKIPTMRELQAEHCMSRIDELVIRCHGLASMDFDLVYDPQRQLLTIGYDIGERRKDSSWYDLLASEARLTSYLLVAQDRVSQDHWFALGRMLTSHSGDLSLMSWSGSMFEYLLPLLFMPGYDHTLLGEACRAAVARQVEYGRQRHVPWGISESCYNAVDVSQTYQYRAFGVPSLGFMTGLGDDLVVAPYATALALTVMPREACRNLRTLADAGVLGQYGLYEAVDYTPTRIPPDSDRAVVRTFMAHHQGMSFLSFAHALLDRPIVRRFASDPSIRTADLLLQERVPKQTIALLPHTVEAAKPARPQAAQAAGTHRVITEPDTPIPEVHLLSNGDYHVMVTHAGGGYSRWRDLLLTRWREDVTSDNHGAFIYLRDRATGEYWSTTYQPTLSPPDRYEAVFVQARAEYRRRDHRIETRTEVCVAPEDDIEIRRVKLTNHSDTDRTIELTSYAEVVLAPPEADLAHRAFSNLFVSTEIVPESTTILCHRRSRAPGDETPWMFHTVSAPETLEHLVTYETDRGRFLGRGNTPAAPDALTSGLLADGSVSSEADLSNTQGPVLDPIVAIRTVLHLAEDDSRTVHVISGVAETREDALALARKYHDRHFVERAFEMAWFDSAETLRMLGITESDAQLYGHLAGSVINANPSRRAAPSVIARNQSGQSGLWRFGISGDRPIILVTIADQAQVDLIRHALRAHGYWRKKGLSTDLVILNEDYSGYRAALHDKIMSLIGASTDAQNIDKPGGVFVRRAEELSEEDRVLFQAVARVVLAGSAESLTKRTQRRTSTDNLPAALRPSREASPQQISNAPKPQRLFSNGLGGFTDDGREYIISTEPGESTPAPWTNVIASPHIGTVVSEKGGAYTWVENAHEYRLTPFENDPLSDTSGEAVYIRDNETGRFWSPTPLPSPGESGYMCRHGFGYSVFEHLETGLLSQLTTYVSMGSPVKLITLKLSNRSGRDRHLSLWAYWELVLGEWRHNNLMHVVTQKDPDTGALFARNSYSRKNPGRIVFAQVSEAKRTMTGDRAEFLGRNGSTADPAALHRTHLSGRTGSGYDPCAALSTDIELADGQESEVVFVLGAAESVQEARRLVQRFGGPAGARQALEEVWTQWSRALGTVYVETPERSLDVLVNGWLVYQVLSSRYWGRSGYYQSGGAYGLRDQLQDSMALLFATPWLTREHLLRCAGRQFHEGDAQHWWHPPTGQGVRSRSSDDYLWLPWAVCHYVKTTGDTGVLDEQVPFLEGRLLGPQEEAYYDQPQRSAEVSSLYAHCVRALENGLRFGDHGLPLMGSGDWNDGMNLVGMGGRGESVWLAWFLYDNLRLFERLAGRRGDEHFAKICADRADDLHRNIEEHAWDGKWYRRAYFDDGTPLGSSTNTECRIDSISQSWAVISGASDRKRSLAALKSVDKLLVDREARLVRLLHPPFDRSDVEPGYIKGYLPGVRENGGQYTHAAIWAAMAFALAGDIDKAWEFFGMLNPISHSSDPLSTQTYKVEPYVVAADIYSTEPHTGRGGWTWYTGAAGWMYRLAVETLLGFHLEVDRLRLEPRVPRSWDSFKIHYRYRETFYHLHFKRNTDTKVSSSESPHKAGGDRASGRRTAGVQPVSRVTLDGVRLKQSPQDQGTVPLVDDRRDHQVEILFG